ncbi:hypothetical protein [Rhodopirellula baltica]|nr:hypothetical protein [Rhodopirellula baltica]
MSSKSWWPKPTLIWAVLVLAGVALSLNALPLAWSSVHWMMHPDTADSLQWWTSHANAVLYCVTAIFFAYGPPVRATVARTIARLITILFVIVVFPFVASSIQKFWHVRPDSWDLLLWRLDDDWNEGRVFEFLGESIAWLIAIGSLWLISGWRNVALKSRTADEDIVLEKNSRPVTIQRLMALTAMAASFAAILRWLQWSASSQDLVRIASTAAIALSIASVGEFTMRLGQRNRFWAWFLGAFLILLTWTTWFAHRFFSDWYVGSQFPISSDLSDRMQSILFSRYMKIADSSTTSSISHALIGWAIFVALGYRLERTLPDPSSVESSEPPPR